VVAGLVSRAEDWPWSSTRAQLAGEDDELATVALLQVLIPRGGRLSRCQTPRTTSNVGQATPREIRIAMSPTRFEKLADIARQLKTLDAQHRVAQDSQDRETANRLQGKIRALMDRRDELTGTE
jgi:hypothetical protein